MLLTFGEGSIRDYCKVIDKPESESELEKDMIDWNFQTIKQKRLSDDKSLELFGKTNQERYEKYKHMFANHIVDKTSIFDDIVTSESAYVDFERIGKDSINSAYAIVRSKRYKDLQNIIVAYPTSDKNELDLVRSQYDAMPTPDQIRADDYCKEIWGVTNDEMFDACDALIDKLENKVIKYNPIFGIRNNISVDGYLDADSTKIDRIISPNIIVNGVVNVSEGAILLNDTRSRADILRESLYRYDHIEDKTSSEAKTLESTILNLGWIPGIPYDSRSIARSKLLESKTSYEIIDKSQDDINDGDIVKDDTNLLRPIYIVLVEGITLFSMTVKKVTKGPFSHAAICIDDTFKKMYSFNMSNSEGKLGGLSIENAKEYPKDSRLGVFAIFVKEKDYNTIENLLEMYYKNKDKTTYSFFNVLALPFNKAFKMDFNMICSEFVDNILKMTNINIVDKESPLVTPNDFFRASKTNKKIFKLFDGKVKNFQPTKVVNKISKLKKQYIKEFALMEADFPVQFSKDGDLLIKNMKKLNYGDEIDKSNRLLKIYYKEDNREGMKYELARIYFLINLLDKDINASKNEIENTKHKATASNILSTYLKLLLQKEKFNFEEYYQTTPFADATTTIKASTIKYSIETLKQLIKP